VIEHKISEVVSHVKGGMHSSNIQCFMYIQVYLKIGIDRYGFFEADADTDISAIHGLIADTDNRYFQNF